jgi:hypothetical protein
MKKIATLAVLIISGITVLYASFVYGHNNSAPIMECMNCHEGDLAKDMVKITGLPKSFVPGKKYEMTVVITSDLQVMGDVAGGFAVEVSAGELLIKDKKNTQLSDHILTHTQQGSSLRKWSFIWKAPKNKVEAGINVMAVAANGDYSPAADKVGTASYTIMPGK